MEDVIAAALDFQRHELDIENTDWERWADAVEADLGFTLDEDGNTHGYCIDWAYDWFLKGGTVASYVGLVRARRTRRGMP